MKKKFLNMFIIIAILVAIVACASRVKSLIHDSSEGSYHAQGISKEVSIKFDLENKTFVMNFEVTSSMIVLGNIEVEENQIVAVSESGLERYVFKIIDEKTISFVEDESAGSILWEDGTQFIFRASRAK